MQFVNPSFLWALFALAVPVIIHLFNFRKFKKVYFTNVRFLKEVKQETQSKSKLKHLLVLISRMLAVSFLVFAFAQPFIPAEKSKIVAGDKAVSIFIDNSFSMDAMSKSGMLFDEAKKYAEQIVSQYKPTDLFQLLTNDFEGKHQRMVNKEEFLELLDEIKISAAVKSVSEIISRQQDALEHSQMKNKKVFVISDFQQSISDFDKVKSDTGISVNLIPVVAPGKENVFIDSVWFESPVRQMNIPDALNVRLKNISEKKLESNSIKLFINGQQKTPASFNIDANGETVVKLAFTTKETGIQQGRVEILDYPVTYDDKFFFSFNVAKNIPVMNITSQKNDVVNEPDYIHSLFGRDSLFILSDNAENKIDYSALSKNSLIVLNELKAISTGLAQELKRFIRNGGSVLIVPSPEAGLNTYQDFLISAGANYFESVDTVNTKVDKINYEHEIYKDVFEKKQEGIDLPVVSSHYKISKVVRSNEEWMMKLQNGNAFLTKQNSGKGKIYLCAVPLNTEWSNFAHHALFVPTLFKIVIFSQPANELFYTIGKEEVIEAASANAKGENVFHIKGENSFDIIPEHKSAESRTDIFIHNQINEAGNYFLTMGNEKLLGISFNYDRKESDLNCLTTDEILEQYEAAGLTNFTLIDAGNKEISAVLAEISGGKKLWKWCVLLVLLFLAAEVALLRFWK